MTVYKFTVATQRGRRGRVEAEQSEFERVWRLPLIIFKLRFCKISCEFLDFFPHQVEPSYMVGKFPKMSRSLVVIPVCFTPINRAKFLLFCCKFLFCWSLSWHGSNEFHPLLYMSAGSISFADSKWFVSWQFKGPSCFKSWPPARKLISRRRQYLLAFLLGYWTNEALC